MKPIALTTLGAALAVAAPFALRAEVDSAADPAKVDADYAIQGEYEGRIDDTRWGVQIVALGDSRFDLVAYRGGLPGAGWDGNRETLVKGSGERKATGAEFTASTYSGTVADGALHVRDGQTKIASLQRVERKSPTLGAAPPAGAVVLFDGRSTDAWKQARMTSDALLMPGATSKQNFGDFSLHLEFRTPYQPKARGQGRGNSGFYAQGKHEVQILDSFGLGGENNECGGIYSVRRPDVNMCLPPLQWQTYDVEYKAARFDADGKKSANARMTVRHNGVLVHQDVEVGQATTAAPGGDASATGPVNLQDHGNPVRFRNIWIVPR